MCQARYVLGNEQDKQGLSSCEIYHIMARKGRRRRKKNDCTYLFNLFMEFSISAMGEKRQSNRRLLWSGKCSLRGAICELRTR